MRTFLTRSKLRGKAGSGYTKNDLIGFTIHDEADARVIGLNKQYERVPFLSCTSPPWARKVAVLAYFRATSTMGTGMEICQSPITQLSG